ncbi:MAG TPA: hypothetical protein VKA44_07940 [Gemmatimonadota bacterium]|nr:hypothetical protein [Gemmatimonadota bacterium]
MWQLMRRAWEDDSGQDLVEYVLIMVFIALGVAASLMLLQHALGGAFEQTENAMNGQTGAGG